MITDIVIDKITNTKTFTTQHDDGSITSAIEWNPDELKSKNELLRKINGLENKNFNLHGRLGYYSCIIRLLYIIVLGLGLVLFWRT